MELKKLYQGVYMQHKYLTKVENEKEVTSGRWGKREVGRSKLRVWD